MSAVVYGDVASSLHSGKVAVGGFFGAGYLFIEELL